MTHIGGIVGRIDRDEHLRVQALLRKQRERRTYIKEGRPSRAKTRMARKRYAPVAVLNKGAGYSSYSSAAAIGDAIIRSITRREEIASMHGNGVVHVKNGRPMTEHGAKLLGVPWPTP